MIFLFFIFPKNRQSPFPMEIPVSAIPRRINNAASIKIKVVHWITCNEAE